MAFYTEILSEDELSFLRKKEWQEKKQFYKVMTILLVLCFSIPFAVAWVRGLNGAPNAFSYRIYFMSTGTLLLITTIGGAMTHHRNLYPLQKDVRRKTKTIEATYITRKLYMEHNNTYHFYIHSRYRLSIEVSMEDYHRLNEKDEINIEYTSYARIYLGYF